jgi:hypothetical protein
MLVASTLLWARTKQLGGNHQNYGPVADHISKKLLFADEDDIQMAVSSGSRPTMTDVLVTDFSAHERRMNMVHSTLRRALRRFHNMCILILVAWRQPAEKKGKKEKEINPALGFKF